MKATRLPYFLLVTILISSVAIASRQKAEEHFINGLNYMDQRDIKAAIKEFERAGREDKKWAEPHYRMGLGYQIQGNNKKAESSYRRALSLDENHADAAYYLAIIIDSKKLKKAAELFEKGRFADVIDELDTYLNQGGELSRSFLILAYSLPSLSRSSILYKPLFNAFLEQRRWGEAEKLLDFWSEDTKTYGARFTMIRNTHMGYLYLQKGEEEKAKAIYQDVMNKLNAADFLPNGLHFKFLEHFDPLNLNLEMPKVLNQGTPPYTDQAIRARIQGIVILEVVIGVDGKNEPIRILKGLGYGLDESAIDEVRRWVFKPAQLNGKPVPFSATVEVQFNLK